MEWTLGIQLLTVQDPRRWLMFSRWWENLCEVSSFTIMNQYCWKLWWLFIGKVVLDWTILIVISVSFLLHSVSRCHKRSVDEELTRCLEPHTQEPYRNCMGHNYGHYVKTIFEIIVTMTNYCHYDKCIGTVTIRSCVYSRRVWTTRALWSWWSPSF